MRVGTEIRRRRNALGWSLETLSHQCGLSANYLSQLENNQRDPSLSTLEAVAGALGVEIVNLLGEKGGASASGRSVAMVFDSLPPAEQELVLGLVQALASRNGVTSRSGTHLGGPHQTPQQSVSAGRAARHEPNPVVRRRREREADSLVAKAAISKRGVKK